MDFNSNIRYKWFDYFLVFLVFQITVIPFFANYKLLKAILFLLVLFLCYQRSKKIDPDKKIIWIFIVYSLLALIQGFFWGFSLMSLLSSFSFTFLTAYYIYRVYTLNFLIICEKVIFVWTVFCMLMFIAHEIIPPFGSYLTNAIESLHKYSSDGWGARSMIIYTYRPNLETPFGFSRNSGFTHEPGGFAVFIVFGIIINYLRGNFILGKRSLVYFAALFTTISTAGFLSAFVLIGLFINNNKARAISVLIFPILLYGSYFAFSNFEFMSDKLESQYELATTTELDAHTSGRMHAARKSFYVMGKYPFFGRGVLSIATPKDYNHAEQAGGGWTVVLAHYGIIFGTLFLYFFLKGIFQVVKIFGRDSYVSFVISISILINLSAQAFLFAPFFLIFFYFGIYSTTKKGVHR